MFDIYIHDIKDFIFKSLEQIDNTKVIVYIIYFFIYFLLYYIITVPKLMNDIQNNQLFTKIDELSKKKWFIIFIGIIDVLLIISLIVLLYKYIKNRNKVTEQQKLYIVTIPIAIIAFILYFNVLIFHKLFDKIYNSPIVQYIYIILSIIFYGLFFSLFMFNIDNIYNVEFILSIEILLIFLGQYFIVSMTNLHKIYYQLKSNDFSELTINCFNNNVLERYSTDNNSSESAYSAYPSNYLKFNNGIPVSFLNKYTNDYQDLVLADFYYPGSYYSYLVDSPLNGTPSLNALKIGLTKFKTRIIHLDIFSDSINQYDTNANLIIRPENLKDGASPLKLEDCFNMINNWAWINDDPNKMSYPLFIYFKIHFDIANENLCLKLYNLLLKYFSKYLIDKKYGYSGRNNMIPVSMAKMKDSLNKIIIVCDTYPTKTILDELINASTNDLSNNFNIKLYKASYITYDKVGISQDNDKTNLINNSKTDLSFYYTMPDELKKNNSQPKAGMYNPSFQDCAQYGIQGTLMYIFLPDENLNKWVTFFKNKNNFDPVLKDEILRLVNQPIPVITQQDPIIGLQKPQKYCLIPGMMATNKSNLSATNSNNTC
jgi:hypothetical protein